jgi:molybdenum cofactor cytidylyltransferase
MLTDMGFARIGAIVATHTDLPRDGGGVLFESKIVYLADKMVEGTRLVTIGSRYQSARDRFARTPDIASEILQREERVLSVKREFELILGHSLETVIASLGDGPSG